MGTVLGISLAMRACRAPPARILSKGMAPDAVPTGALPVTKYPKTASGMAIKPTTKPKRKLFKGILRTVLRVY
jgi:hypothetical protein